MGNIRQIIQRIANRAPKREFCDPLDDVAQFLRCTIGDLEFVLVGTEVVEVAMVPTIMEIPLSLPVVIGVVNIRGTIVPILDLHEKLNLENHKELEPFASRLVILPIDGEPIGFIVDSIKPQLIGGLVESISEEEAELFSEFVIVGEDRLPILYIEHLINDEERSVLKEICAQF